MKKTALISGCLIFLTLGSACTHQPHGWSVDGEIQGSGEYTLTLEGLNNGYWYVIDSLKTDKGEFKYESAAPAMFPEIFRLGLEGQYIYFPIDSVDRIRIIAEADDFASDYRLDGTLASRTIKTLDSIIGSSVAERGAAITQQDTSLKQELFMRAFEDPSVMPLYYLMNKSVGDKALFEIDNPVDLRLYGAVAQRFAIDMPEDPRGHYLANVFTSVRASQNQGQIQTIEVPTTSVIDIVRTDSHGKRHSLAEMSSNGDVVVLSFTAYGLESSPAYNVILNDIYEKYHKKGLKIYQIGFDGNEALWKETARNLPWTTVWNSTTDGNTILASYNVGALPTTFIIDRSGTVAARVEDPSEIEKEVARLM